MTILVDIKCFQMPDFPAWLQEQMQRQGINASQLAKRASLDPGFMGRVLNGSRNPGIETYQSIAHALRLPTVTVLQAAGILKAQEQDAELTELLGLFEQMESAGRLDVLEYARFKAGAPRPSVPLIYAIFDNLSRQPRQGILLLVQDPAEVHSIFEPDQYRFVQHAQIPGQGWIIEAIDDNEGE